MGEMTTTTPTHHRTNSKYLPKDWLVPGLEPQTKAAKKVVTIVICVLWYACNISVVLLNKALLTTFEFKKPVILTLCHMLTCSILSYFVSLTKIFPRQYVQTRSQLVKICTLAGVFVTSIVLGNVSLRYIPVSFNQAIGATTPFFTAMLAALIQAKFESRVTYISLIPVVVGIIITTGGEPSFHTFGFLACVGGTFCRGLKSVMQAVLLSSENEKMSSMNLLMYMSPAAVVILIFVAAVVEPTGVYDTLELLKSPFFCFILWANCVLAYCLNLLNFLVTRYTSALTLQVLGNGKGVVAAGVSIAIFRNPVTVQGMLGYFITIAGVVAYSESKKRTVRIRSLSRGEGVMKDNRPSVNPSKV